jgi:DNA-binding protein H-NS
VFFRRREREALQSCASAVSALEAALRKLQSEVEEFRASVKPVDLSALAELRVKFAEYESQLQAIRLPALELLAKTAARLEWRERKRAKAEETPAPERKPRPWERWGRTAEGGQ